MADYSNQGAPKSGGNKTVIWIVVILLVILLLGVGVCCGGPVILTWMGVGAAMQLVADEVKKDIEDNPVIVEHIGAISSFKVNLSKSGEGNNVMAFDIVGDKGKGTVRGTIVANMLMQGTLTLEDGREFSLDDSDSGASPFDESSEGEENPFNQGGFDLPDDGS